MRTSHDEKYVRNCWNSSRENYQVVRTITSQRSRPAQFSVLLTDEAPSSRHWFNLFNSYFKFFTPQQKSVKLKTVLAVKTSAPAAHTLSVPHQRLLTVLNPKRSRTPCTLCQSKIKKKKVHIRLKRSADFWQDTLCEIIRMCCVGLFFFFLFQCGYEDVIYSSDTLMSCDLKEAKETDHTSWWCTPTDVNLSDATVWASDVRMMSEMN